MRPDNSAIHVTIEDVAILIRRATLDEIIDLRHRVLRDGLPRESAVFPGDHLPTSGHFAAFQNSTAVCCATFHLNTWENAPAYQLRGMATDSEFRGKGLGRAVLQLAEKTMTDDQKIVQLWCNAREIAVPFYKSMGWTIVSDRFSIPSAGPHFRMIKRMESLQA